MLLNYIFLPIIFFICSVTSYQDFSFGKIKNKWIILGLCWGLLAYGFLFLWSHAAFFLPHWINPLTFSFALTADYILKVLINTLISFVVGYILWYFRLWSAGDAKLFVVLTFLLPLDYYSKNFFLYFPSIILLINVFLPAFVYMTISSLVEFSRGSLFLLSSTGGVKIFLNKIKTYLVQNYLKLFKNIFLLFSILFAYQIIRVSFYHEIGFVISRSSALFLLIFLAVNQSSVYIKRIFKKRWILTSFYLAVIPCLFFLGYFDSFESALKLFEIIKHSLIFSIFFIPLLYLFDYSSQGSEQTKVMPFAVWFFVGIIVTIILKESLLSFFLHIFFGSNL
jgi:hypothetical protein